MRNNYLSKCWFGPIPDKHLGLSQKTPKEYLLKFLIHPLKRKLAKYYLVFLRKVFGLKVIGITGSAGKTTTKEMTASILKRVGRTSFSYANIDPVYNIPSTILKCSPLTRFLVLEMGVEFPGEMDYYLWLAKPDIALITNVYPTHTEFFKNVGGVAREKGKLARALGANNFVILNNENQVLREISRTVKAKIVWYGKEGDVRAENARLKDNTGTEFTLKVGKDKLVVHLPVVGEQFVSNALGAAAIAHCLKVTPQDIKVGLENFKPLAHRMTVHLLKSGAILLDDTYNNNPEAAKEALVTLKSIAGKRKMVVIMGDMLELGELSLSAHRELGRLIGSLKVSGVIGVGPASYELVRAAKESLGDKAFWVSKAEEALPLVKSLSGRDTVILIKGSRAIGLDRLVAKLI